MSFDKEKEADRRRGPDQTSNSGKSPHANKKGPPTGAVGNALRTVYQRTVDEQIPPDLLDLLGKLG